MEPDLLTFAGVDLDRLTILRPRDGVDTLNRALAQLAAQPAHVLIISGLPSLSRRDQLFIGLLERLALLLPGARTILLILSGPDALTDPHSTAGALGRLAAVRLALDNEVVTRDRGRLVYAADLIVLKHRFAARRLGGRVAIRLTARAPWPR